MADITTYFNCASGDGGHAEIYQNDGTEIGFIIYNKKGEHTGSLLLNKSTAIKFAKTLRTEINKIEEGQDGGK